MGRSHQRPELPGEFWPIAFEENYLIVDTDAIHRRDGRVVGILTPASRYFRGLLELVRAVDPDAKTAAVVYRRGSSFGRLAAGGAESAGREDGFAVASVTYSSFPDDLPRLLAELGRQGPDLVLGAGTFKDDCALARGLIAAGVRAKAIGLAAAAIQDFRQALGSEAEGFLAPSQWEHSLRPNIDFGPSPSTVAKRIRAMGATADYPAAQAYAACVVAQRCLEEAGTLDDEALWRAACNLDCTNFFGRFQMDPLTGLQVGHEMVWVQWQRGRKVVVWPLAQTGPDYPKA